MCQSEASPFLSSDVDLAVVAESPRCHGMRQVALLYPHCLSIKLAFLFLVTRGEPVKVITQGDHLSGKPGNVREFDSCQGFY